MALSIKHPDADRLARELARRQGRSITEVVVAALAAELEREKRRVRSPGMVEDVIKIAARYSALPDLDTRGDDEILGYDERGIPG